MISPNFRSVMKTVFFSIFLLFYTTSYTQSAKPFYLQAPNWEVLSRSIKNKFLYEAKHSNKFDAVYKVNDFSYYSFKDIKDNKIELHLLQFEQAFNEDSSFTSTYKILMTIYKDETGHAVRLLDTDNFILSVSCNELFNKEDLKLFLNTNKKQLKEYFYNDFSPWRKFKSYNTQIKIDKLKPISKLINSVLYAE